MAENILPTDFTSAIIDQNISFKSLPGTTMILISTVLYLQQHYQKTTQLNLKRRSC